MGDKKVRMIVQISGSRDGEDWPAPGQEVSLPEDEANQLLAMGQAAELNPPEEDSLADVLGVETAVAGNRSIRSQLKPAAHADETGAYHVPVLPGEIPAAEESQKNVDEHNAEVHGVDVDVHKAQRDTEGLDALKGSYDHPAAKRASASRTTKKDGAK